jgi:hypothetical protein
VMSGKSVTGEVKSAGFSMSGNPTSMIGRCQEGKSSPDALRWSACTNSFLILRRVCWLLSRGSFFRLEPDFCCSRPASGLEQKIEFVFSCQSRN